jgi:hypothetical protein
MTINELIEKLKTLYDFKSDDTYTSAVKDCIGLILDSKPELRLPVYRATAPADWEDATCGMCAYRVPRADCIRQQEIDGNPECYGCKRLEHCRKFATSVKADDHACPDFHLRVPRGENNDK